jgi:deazaflavin-dependent oxidoreductase (nitroreductase family)
MRVHPALIRFASQTHLFWYRLTGGLIGGSLGIAPVLFLTTTGRKTGRPRVTPLLYLTDGDDFVVAASNGGNTNHPAWWLNLEARPEAEVEVGRRRLPVEASKATGERRRRLWRQFVDVYSGYSGYERTAGREIPVVILSPRADARPDGRG